MSDKTGYLASILGRDTEALMALREVPAFHDCSAPLLEMLFRYGKVAVLRQGQDLTREGEFDQWVYFIISGQLAVYVGDEHVDTISSSLVGERCILGEHRRATLRATHEGVTALGVDMALLDALRDRASEVREPISVYLELLSIIASEVVNRIAELEFNLLDFSYKYVAHKRTERVSDILRDLREGAYADERSANFAVYRYLLKHHPVALSRCVAGEGAAVDTCQLYRDAVLNGDYPLLYGVADAVQAARAVEEAAANGAAPAAPGKAPEADSFASFVTSLAGLIARQHGGQHWDEAAVQAVAGGIRKRMGLDGALRVDLHGLIRWLIAEHRFTAEDTIDLLMTVLKESSDVTARINGRIKSMVHELAQTRFAKELGARPLEPLTNVAEYYHSTPLDELIPFFSRNILDVYLVQPYMERLHALEGGAWDGRSGAASQEPAGLISTLFD